MAGQKMRLIRSLLIGIGLSIPLSVWAQTAQLPSEGAATAVPTDQLTEITVTARKREERTLDVPTSITAIGSAEIARYATTDLQSLSNQIPQLEITTNPSGTGAVVTIRGIGTSNTGDDGVEQAVSLNMDGVPTSRGRVIQQGLFDLESIQVLKGPQALYFGKKQSRRRHHP